MRKSTVGLAGLAFSTAAVLVAGKLRGRRKLADGFKSDRKAEVRRIADQSSQRYMMYFIVPVWALVGVLDWLWHKQSKIETTSGPKESFMHLLMMMETGLPVFASLFLEVNAGLLAMITAGVLLHQATVMWDVSYTVSRRKIPAREQHTHTFMETIPFDILAVHACLHPDQFLSLLRLGPEKADYSLRLRKPGLPVSHIAAIFGATGLFVGLPHVEEFVRCWRTYRKGLTGVDTPECARELYAA